MVSATFGDWAGLARPDQAARYRHLAHTLSGATTVLDVGCGEAVLKDWLSPVVEYIGLDTSPFACEAAKRRHPDASILCVRAEDATIRGRVDAVVLNEMLYYCTDPVAVVARATKWLTTDGTVICSIFQHYRPRSLRQAVTGAPQGNLHAEYVVRRFMHEARWQILSDVVVETAPQNFHHIWIARP